ncbi:MAG: helix-turn-helix domain-containing protein [Nocardioides sp.]
MISVEDWALIRRLVADGVPQRQVARDLGVGRSTVARAVASDGPPKYERQAVPTSFTPFEPAVRQLLVTTPDMPATVRRWPDGDQQQGKDRSRRGAQAADLPGVGVEGATDHRSSRPAGRPRP